MNDSLRIAALTLSIAAVERDTGLSKDTLRVWERRYGFPAPGRDGTGERTYTLDQVEKLRVVKRLLDAGHRPGRVVQLPLKQLQHLADQTVGASLRGAPAPLGSEDVSAHLDLIRRHDAPGLRAALTRLLSRFGVGRFVIEVVAPLNVAVGDAWLRGHLQVFEEHMYTEVMQAVLRQAVVGIPALPVPGRPRVLLTTFPGEQHGLGLLMAEAVLALEGCACISLGVQTPLWDIVLATKAFGTDIVALSFTGSSHPNQVADGLAELRAKLPPSVAVWAGGSSPVLIRRRVQGVLHLDALDELADALEDWRARSGPR